MTASKRHSINGAKVQGVWGVGVSVCALRQGPLLCCVLSLLFSGGGSEAHHQETTEKGQKARRIGTEGLTWARTTPSSSANPSLVHFYFKHHRR